MLLQNYYYCFPEGLPHHLCDDIVKFALAQKDELAMTGKFGNNKNLDQRQLEDLKGKRNSRVVWLSEPWIYKEIHPFIHQANKAAGWNFTWDRSESCQFTKYKLNQHYDWHCDSWNKPYERKDPHHPEHGKTRKLSSILTLSSPDEYSGGELELDYRNYEPVLRDDSQHVIRVPGSELKGTLIVFPSFVWHRVKPVTAGTRYSLPTWHIGAPFK